MADIARGLRFTVDLDSGLIVRPQTAELMQGDKNADRVIIQLERNRQPVDLTGVSVSGTFQRASGDIVPLTGTASGSEVSLILGEHCYAETGAYEIQARLQIGSERRTVVVVTGRVRRKGDGRIIDVENVVPSLEDIFAQLDTMRAVTAEAKTATSSANAAAVAATDAKEACDAAVNALPLTVEGLFSDLGLTMQDGKLCVKVERT